MSKKTLFWHVIFWIVYMSIFTFVEGGYNNNFRQALFIELAYFPIRIIVVYTNYFAFVPRLLLREHVFKYIIYTLLTVFAGTVLYRYFAFTYINPFLYPDWNQGAFLQPYRFVQSAMIITSPMIFLIGITVIYRLVESQRRIAEIAEERTKAELQYLKSQINPHFFFNTLNNLYGLALAKSDKTPDVVMKLSELMSYMLYETQHQIVPIEKEITYIKNYIELEKIRFEGRFSCELDIENMSHLNIPPMLLLPFVENAFKHGVHTSSKDAWIKVGLRMEGKQLTFKVANSIGEKQNERKGGLGIANLKRRLELLYPDKYVLDIQSSEDTFLISLKIELPNEKA